MMIVKKRLNYMPAVTRTEPVKKIPVNSSKMRELDMSIKEKCRQNHLNDHNLQNDQLYYNENSNNFNEEIERELAELQLGGKVVPIDEEDKATSEDYAKLEAQILLRTEENRKMLFQSSINAEHSLPVGKGEQDPVKKLVRN